MFLYPVDLFERAYYLGQCCMAWLVFSLSIHSLTYTFSFLFFHLHSVGLNS